MRIPEVPDWKTDDMLRAEAALAEATHTLDMELERAEQLLAATPDEPLTDEEVARFKDHCTGIEWGATAERVERGEFTWREIAEGTVDDPAVEAAMAAMRPRPVPAEDDDEYFTEERFLEPE